MDTQVFFLLEYNLQPLQMLLRGFRCSCFLPTDQEIGLSNDAEDPDIIARVSQQKIDLGIDRIIITRDKSFTTHLGNNKIKVIILNDKTKKHLFYNMRMKSLAKEIVATAQNMLQKSQGEQAIALLNALNSINN
ncbi:hypothetical protein KY338_04790 [Candidatus Woesearchaeota archaeon]|nr:hypothetical protein [Candidatus Woesearchaeota archaeon]MBW3006223.1 hypothetical protein [Candidatus Woesearchaeota archaeon]